MTNRVGLSRRRPDDARHPFHVPALVGATTRADRPQRGRILNLSRGGLAVHLQEALPPKTPVRITLQPHRRPVLTWLGRVVWIEPADPAGTWVAGVSLTPELAGELVADITVDESSSWGETPDAVPDEE